MPLRVRGCSRGSTACGRKLHTSTCAAATGRAKVDETYEPAHRLLAAVHLARGDRSGARTALAYCRTVMGGLGLPLEPATEVLARRIGQAD